MKYKPHSIKEETVPVFLERTKDMHNGQGWSDFKQLLDLGVPKPRIADSFGVSTQRIWAWISIYNESES